jgi:RNA polymerase sigma-70 factor (ECF subfamily)
VIPGNTISDPGFQTTRWSLVAALDHARDTPGLHSLSAIPARQRLLELCLRYWYPVYVYLRRSGHGAEAAQGLAAHFFDNLLRRRGSGASRGHDGRFRTFLMAELHRFLAEDALSGGAGDDATTPALDPDLPIPPLAQLEARRQREGDAGGSPELALRRGFALEVIAQAMRRIEDEAREAGRLPMFSALQPYLASDPVPGLYADIAQRLDVSPLFLSLALKRLRERFRELVDDELAQTVASAAALEEERRSLHAALQSAA